MYLPEILTSNFPTLTLSLRSYFVLYVKTHRPSPTTMDNMATTFRDLYCCPPSPNPTNDLHQPQINYSPQPVLDSPPTAEEILQAVTQLRRWRAPGPSKLRAEDLQRWANNPTDKSKWEQVVNLVQHVFITGEVPQRLCYCNLVLIPKTGGGVRGIGLLEPIWKIISSIIKNRIADKVTFDDALHGFRSERGTSTAIIEAKLRMDTMLASGKNMYQVFLDLSKAYDTVNRTKLLWALQHYGVGEIIIRILRTFWSQLWVIPKQKDFYGTPF
jgi:Reverse transcriptase (RNA-dependent DNA polymerase)